MRTVKLTSRQHEVVRMLDARDLRMLRKYPRLVREAKHLIKACKKVIKHVEALHAYTNAKKRQTSYKRIAKICSNALESIERR